MRLAHQAEINGDLRTTRRLLERHAGKELEAGSQTLEGGGSARLPTPDFRLLTTSPKPDLRGWEWRYLWRQSQGSPRVVLAEHTNAVWAVGLLPGGQGAYSAGLDGVVKLVDLMSRQIMGELRHDDQVSIGVPSPDGQWFVTLTRKPNGDGGKKPVVLWDLPARREVAVLASNVWPRETTLAISPDSKVFAFVNQTDPEHLLVCELPSGREIARFPAQTDLMEQQGVAFTPDGGTLVFSTDVEGTLALVDTSRWREVGRLKGHRRNVVALAVSPDGRWLASASADRSLRLWDLRVRQEVASRHALTAPSWSVAFSPDGTRLAAAIGHAVSIFSVPALDPISEIRSPSGGVDSVAFVSDQEVLAGAGTGSAALYSLDSEAAGRDGVRFNTGLAQFLWDSKSSGPATCLSPDNAALLGVFTNGTFAVWKLPGLQSTGTWPLPVTNFSCAAISARGETVAFADQAGNVVLWRAADGQVTPFGKVGNVRLSRMAFSMDDRQLAFGGWGRRYGIWDVSTRKETHTFDDADAGICMDLEFSPDNQALVAGLFTGVALYWPLNQSGTPQTLRVAEQQVRGLAFADQGKTLITARGGVRFWNLSLGVQTRHLTDLAGEAFSVALSPDETRMAIGYVDGSLSIFDRGTGEEVMRLKAFDLNVRHVAFSADGNSLIASSLEQIRVWRAAPFSETDPKHHPNALQP